MTLHQKIKRDDTIYLLKAAINLVQNKTELLFNEICTDEDRPRHLAEAALSFVIRN